MYMKLLLLVEILKNVSIYHHNNYMLTMTGGVTATRNSVNKDLVRSHDT